MQDILRYLKIVRKWWWVIALLSGSTVITILLVALLNEPQYKATVTIQVSAPPPQETPLFSQFGRNDGVSAAIEQTRNSFSEFLQAGDAAWRALEVLPDIHLDGRELRENIEIEIPPDSQLMRITVLARDPETAALLANTVVTKGLEGYGQLLAKPTANTRVFIEQQLELARAEFNSAENELIQTQIDNKIGDLKQAINSQYDLVNSLKTESDLAKARGNLIRVATLETIIIEREVELQNMIGLSAEYSRLADQVQRMRDTYGFLLDKSAEAQIKENQLLELGSIQVITPARPPDKPTLIIGDKIILLGIIMSFLVGILLTFVLEYLEISGMFSRSQNTVKRSEDVVLADSLLNKPPLKR